MKIKKPLLFSLLTLSFCATYARGVCVIEEPTLRELKGFVKQHDSQIIPQTTIKVYKNTGDGRILDKTPLKETKGDENGYFEIKNLASRQYLVVVSGRNYSTLFFTVNISKKKEANDQRLNVFLGWDLDDDCGGGTVSIDPTYKSLSAQSTGNASKAQSAQSSGRDIYDYVRLTANVDDKPVKVEKIKIEVLINRVKILPLLSKDGFYTDTLKWIDDNEQKAELKISLKRYELDFSDISKSHFRGEWNITINNPPFKPSEDIPDPDKVDYVYAVRFNSGRSIGTVPKQDKI